MQRQQMQRQISPDDRKGPACQEAAVDRLKGRQRWCEGQIYGIPGVRVGVQDLDDGVRGQLQPKLLQHSPRVTHTASTVAPGLVPAPSQVAAQEMPFCNQQCSVEQ